MDATADQPHSPSARFYANRQSECPEAFNTFPHPDLEQQHACQRVPSFNHFQGFSAPPSHQHSRNICAGCQWDERVSPRTTVPSHSHQLQQLTRQRLEQFPCENNHMILSNYSSTQHHVNSLMHTYQDVQTPRRARQLSGPPMYMTPPPLYFSDPESALNPLHAERPISMMFSSQGATAEPLPVLVQHPIHGSNTIRVPSYSPSSDASQRPRRLIHEGRTLAYHEEGQPSSSSDEEDDMSTVYPNGSTTTSSPTPSPMVRGNNVPSRPLEEAVVEIHNICLAAAQRYLESLRVNWGLRQGNEILTHAAQAGPTRRLRDRLCARSSPYPSPRRRKRALSDNSGLELMLGLGGGGVTCDDEEENGTGSQQQHAQSPCPIPAPTNSLLQNTSHICELVWRRACRDRGDVLGAEAAATHKMALLVGCAETVVLYDAGEWNGDPQKGFYSACRAGRDFCAELGDMCGVGKVEVVEWGDIGE